jgi:alpha/beta superfamily hydrolase
MAGRRKTATQQAGGGTFASDPPFAAYWGEQETREAPIMIRWLRSTYPDLFVALILSFAALIAFFASKGTAYHQLAIGLLASAVSWLLRRRDEPEDALRPQRGWSMKLCPCLARSESG